MSNAYKSWTTTSPAAVMPQRVVPRHPVWFPVTVHPPAPGDGTGRD